MTNYTNFDLTNSNFRENASSLPKDNNYFYNNITFKTNDTPKFHDDFRSLKHYLSNNMKKIDAISDMFDKINTHGETNNNFKYKHSFGGNSVGGFKDSYFQLKHYSNVLSYMLWFASITYKSMNNIILREVKRDQQMIQWLSVPTNVISDDQVQRLFKYCYMIDIYTAVEQFFNICLLTNVIIPHKYITYGSENNESLFMYINTTTYHVILSGPRQLLRLSLHQNISELRNVEIKYCFQISSLINSSILSKYKTNFVLKRKTDIVITNTNKSRKQDEKMKKLAKNLTKDTNLVDKNENNKNKLIIDNSFIVDDKECSLDDIINDYKYYFWLKNINVTSSTLKKIKIDSNMNQNYYFIQNRGGSDINNVDIVQKELQCLADDYGHSELFKRIFKMVVFFASEELEKMIMFLEHEALPEKFYVSATTQNKPSNIIKPMGVNFITKNLFISNLKLLTFVLF